MTSDLHPLQHPLYKLSTYPYKMSLIFIENPLNPTKGAMQNPNQNNKRTKNASWKQTQMWEFRTWKYHRWHIKHTLRVPWFIKLGILSVALIDKKDTNKSKDWIVLKISRVTNKQTEHSFNMNFVYGGGLDQKH